MNRPLTALFAALEALLVVGVGIGIPLVPLTLMWSFQYGLQLDWVVFWRAAVDAWLLGHGADLTFTLDPALAAGLGLAGAGEGIVATIALLGFSLVTVLLAIRAGRRIGETPHGVVGLLVSIGVVALLSAAVALSAAHPLASPSLPQSIILPTLVFSLGVGVGFLLGRGRADVPTRLAHWIDDRAPHLRRIVAVCVTGGVASTFLLLTVAAIALATAIGLNYGGIIAIYEGVQSGVLGGAMLTVAQLALLPNLVIWSASFLVGPGFSIGTGSAVSPLGTLLGPIPAIPVLGALPTGDWTYAFVGILVPVLAGFLSALVLRPRLVRAGLDGRWWLIGAGLGMGLVGGIILGALAWASAGSAGPGRLADVGPSWLPVGGWAALEIGAAAVLALFVAGIRRSKGADVPAGERAPVRAPAPNPSTVSAGLGSATPTASIVPAAPAASIDPSVSAASTDSVEPASSSGTVSSGTVSSGAASGTAAPGAAVPIGWRARAERARDLAADSLARATERLPRRGRTPTRGREHPLGPGDGTSPREGGSSAERASSSSSTSPSERTSTSPRSDERASSSTDTSPAARDAAHARHLDAVDRARRSLRDAETAPIPVIRPADAAPGSTTGGARPIEKGPGMTRGR